MTPFEQYMQESKSIRDRYNVLIAANPEKKTELLSQMGAELKAKLDICEQKEIEASKHV